MKGPRLTLSQGMALVVLVAVDLGVIRYAMAPWELGESHRQPLLNVLPMLNALLLVGIVLAGGRRKPRPFAAGFFVGGLVALLIHVAVDRSFPKLAWSVTDWLANRLVPMIPLSFRQANPWIDYKSTAGSLHFGPYPMFALVVSAPQFLLAILSGALYRRFVPSGPASGADRPDPPS